MSENYFIDMDALFYEDEDTNEVSGSNFVEDKDFATFDWFDDISADSRSGRKKLHEGTTGSAMWDFLGQATWGGVSELTLSLPEVHDIWGEAQRGDAYTTWHKSLLGYDADW